MRSKFEVLRKILDERMAIAFSGGVDSSTLAALCKAWNVDVIAITAKIPFISKRDLKNAEKAAKEIGVFHIVVDAELPPEVFENTPLRCYFCKKTILRRIKEVARKRGFEVVADGTNADDMLESRPGLRALEEEGILSPWASAGFTKEEIRRIAKDLGLSFYNRPSNSCLATRIPHGEKIRLKDLKKVELAEDILLKLVGERRVRVRKFGSKAVVEIEEFESVKENLANAVAMLKSIGFEEVVFLN